jgi:hypothetical protein
VATVTGSNARLIQAVGVGELVTNCVCGLARPKEIARSAASPSGPPCGRDLCGAVVSLAMALGKLVILVVREGLEPSTSAL